MDEKLRYVRPGVAGYTRVRRAKGFVYRDETGKPLKDPETLDRINKLVLPPAWTDVWICPWPNGHLQATGVDAMGRKQYRYHVTWNKTRSEKKFHRLLEFGKRLPSIRKRLEEDLSRKELDRRKVIAIALRTMEETLIRVGNAVYEKLYGSYGLTTLQNRHLSINGGTALFTFKGKKGVRQRIELKEKHLVRLLKKVMEIPGQELFQYMDETGRHLPLDSGEVNEYIREAAGEEFSCKDFRTWAGSVYALQLLAGAEPAASAAECKRQIVEVIRQVSCRLGNTATVCKKYYIDPQLLNAYETGSLKPFMLRLRAGSHRKGTAGGLHTEEKVFLAFLQRRSRNLAQA
ncbi:MAG TPA: hypothetical protein VL547_19530 [Dinghuibacter sp.]|jgi:DNA topoisomerase-1|uniref:DNA topoisomerase IB n=1 Tax=Dinghuibacter sp. TaxID=2024697 RepID=UPI002C7C7F39|nr:DNA topoisomerase IB [Dinghuibacter sp.]HTJ14244.1 hypothetical protein [Dinghuibacter sp.]